ncbi:hypothetical protein AVL48_00990 [Amycolatopsis regifaucium]|uniref:Uncharacterized protein n=1 Tax=Amycolatopsis regifaucium TaxID=546365 RepID=A0A154MWL0_9PSEU|nr:hypothetical protein AVL48_00990 [Amycolatopsis regifaucium]
MGTGLSTDTSTVTPAPPTSSAGSIVASQGQRPYSPVKTTIAMVRTSVVGAVTSNQASWRPRTSWQAEPGIISLPHSSVPSSAYWFAEIAATHSANTRPVHGRKIDAPTASGSRQNTRA